MTLAAYYLVERPGRRLSNILPPVVAGVCLVAAISAGLVLAKPAYDLSRFAPTVWMGNVYDVSPKQVQNDFIKNRMDGIIQPKRDPKETDAYTRGGIIKRYGGDQVEVVLLGNSHALMWAPIIDEICQESRLTVAFNAAVGTPPFPAIVPVKQAAENFTPEEWFAFDTARMKFIESWRPRLIIIAHRWAGVSEGDPNILHFLNETLKLNCRVLFIGDPPELAIGDINTPQFVSSTCSSTVQVRNMNEFQRTTESLKTLTKQYTNTHLVEVSDLYLTNSKRVKTLVGDTVFYIDDDHLSLVGASMAKERIKNAVGKLVSKK
jgi:hypothetical protein